jgi:hypothetical protein
MPLGHSRVLPGKGPDPVVCGCPEQLDRGDDARREVTLGSQESRGRSVRVCGASSRPLCAAVSRRESVTCRSRLLETATNDLIQQHAGPLRINVSHSIGRGTTPNTDGGDSARGGPHKRYREPHCRTTSAPRRDPGRCSGGGAGSPTACTRSRPLSPDRTRCPRCPASRGTTRRRHRQAVVARVPRRARPVVRIRPQVRPGALHPRARCRPARQDAADS